jgi:hypothetical protein
MKRRVRIAAIAVGSLLVLLLLVYLAVRSRAIHEGDPAARLPADAELVVRVPQVAEAGPFLAGLFGVDVSRLPETGWKGRFGAAAAAVRGAHVVAMVECPALAAIGPLEEEAARALGLKAADGAWERGGVRFWTGSRRNLFYIATDPKLLADALARADVEQGTRAASGLTLEDRGAVAAMDARPMNDLMRWLWNRVRAHVEPGAKIEGRFTASGLELSGARPAPLAGCGPAEKELARQRAGPSRLAGLRIPGVAWFQADDFHAPAVWHEIFNDPDNARFVTAFNHEISEYEKFLGGRDFETELLPRLGPSRAWAVARVDHASFRARVKSPLPAILFMVDVRGIEDEVWKSLDRFLSDAEREGHRFDLPAPRGAVAPVLDPFTHQEVAIDGQKLVRLQFREGVSDFGDEFSPGYAVVDGALCISTFWPLLPRLARAAVPEGPAGHRRGFVDGAAARGIARDNAGDLAGMTATWDLLDRLAPDADREFAARYGRAPNWLEPMIQPFTDLEAELRRERPELRDAAFDAELERRLDAWIAQEKRALAARRAEPLKKGEAFRADSAARKQRLEDWILLADGFARAEWWSAHEGDEVRWGLTISPRR